jgi:catechol 2,3-dioxygenase
VTRSRDRLPPGTRLGRVTLRVADLERSLAFYRGVLGLEARAGAWADRLALGPPGGETLLELEARAGTRAVPPGGRIGLYHVALLLPDRAGLGRFARHLQAVGARAGAADHLVSEAFYLTDPDGLGIEVYADRPREAWGVRGGELHMDTLPLDLEGLLAETNGEAWTGMPRATTVGHVHLHVGDLERARAFYVDAVGFDVTVASYPGALFLAAGPYHHHLGLNTWSRSAPAGEDDARLLGWEIVVPTRDDLAAAARRLARGAPEHRGASGALPLVDPWGTPLTLRSARA